MKWCKRTTEFFSTTLFIWFLFCIQGWNLNVWTALTVLIATLPGHCPDIFSACYDLLSSAVPKSVWDVLLGVPVLMPGLLWLSLWVAQHLKRPEQESSQLNTHLKTGAAPLLPVVWVLGSGARLMQPPECSARTQTSFRWCWGDVRVLLWFCWQWCRNWG